MLMLLLFTGLLVGDPAPVAPVRVQATVGIDFMLDTEGYGTIRRALSEQADTVGLWPLHEISGTLARNVSEDRNHGTYSGSMNRGQLIDIPEGAIGVRLNGGWIEIPDDSALGLTNNLSLAAGGANIRFFIITTHNDTTPRCIAQKMTTDETGDGWAVYLDTGNLVAIGRNSGVVIFNVASADIADGQLHFCDFVFQPDTGSGLWKVDGVTSGSPVVGLTTELNPTNANVRFGAFNDGTGTHTLTTLGLVNLSRQGNVTLAPIIEAMREWTDKSADRRGPITIQYGIPGTAPDSRTAGIGSVQVVMDNRRNGGGAYSPNHQNAIDGFDLGIPMRVTLSYGEHSKVVRTNVMAITPTAGSREDRRTYVTGVDYMNTLAETSITRVSAQLDAVAWSAWALIVAEAERSPVAANVSIVSPTLPYFLDSARSESTKVLTELQRIHQSGEFGWTLIKNQSPGGILTYEDRETIQAKQPVATFDGAMHEFEISYDVESLINTAIVSVTARAIPPGEVVLYQAGSDIVIGPMETVTVDGFYLDEDHPGRRVGAINIVTPVATTDYTAYMQDSPTNNVTGDLVVTTSKGANGVRLSVLYSRVDSYAVVDFLRVRGEIVASDEHRESVVESDGSSVKKYGPREYNLDMPYQDDLTVAKETGKFVIGTRSGPVVAARMRFKADNSVLMPQALQREPGDVIEVREAMTTGDSYRNYYIMHVTLDAEPGGTLWCEWLLAPVRQGEGRYWTLGISRLGVDTTLAWGI